MDSLYLFYAMFLIALIGGLAYGCERLQGSRSAS
jgi:flagellar biogenesis protein FliO